ncbi:MAG: hypothetical protein KGM15_16275 [Pseudomonadota bacterium]|nr:hypothetical protein [Pseudomonadota bacterium]
MNAQYLENERKSLAAIWNGWQGGNPALADIQISCLALTYLFDSKPTSIASIGIPAREELLAGNAMMAGSNSYVILGTQSSREYRSQLNDLNNVLLGAGAEPKTQTADLTLAGSWPKLLQAMVIGGIGVLGMDAAWAISEPNFWNTLKEFVAASGAAVYIRGALDWKHAGVSMALLRSMPADIGMDFVASTPSSLWFAPAGESAGKLRQLLRTSGIVSDPAEREDDKVAFTIENTWMPGLVDDSGRVARMVIPCNRPVAPDIYFATGWSSVESDGRWTNSEDKSLITVPLPAEVETVNRVAITGNAWVSPTDTDQVVEFGVGSGSQSRVTQTFNDGGEILTIALKVSPVDISNRQLSLWIGVRSPGRPSDHGASDTRLLGYKVRTISVFG